MCTGSKPKAPPLVPAAQAAHAPDQALTYARSSDRQRRRFGFAATMLSPAGGMGAPNTSGKSLLGQ